jgi:hypothetical protein
VNDTLGNRLNQSIESLPVPQFNFSGIKARAERRAMPRKVNRRNVATAIITAFALPAVALAAVHFMPLGVTHVSDNWQLRGVTQTYMNPSAALFDKAARMAPYRVVWPAGLPQTSKPNALGVTGSEVFIAFYNCPNGRSYMPGVWAIIVPRHYNQVNSELGQWLTHQMAIHQRKLL